MKFTLGVLIVCDFSLFLVIYDPCCQGYKKYNIQVWTCSTIAARLVVRVRILAHVRPWEGAEMKIGVIVSLITTTYSTNRYVASVYNFKVIKNFLPPRQSPRGYGPAPVDKWILSILYFVDCSVQYLIHCKSIYSRRKVCWQIRGFTRPVSSN